MKLLLTLFLVATLVFSLHAGEQTLCPIMVTDEIDVEEVVEYQGKEIYMCCGGCVKVWNKNPDYYAAAAIAVKSDQPLLPQLDGVELPEVKLLKQRFCPLREDTLVGPESPFIEYEGKKIYFYKERDIERKWSKDPEGLFKEAREAGLLPQFDD
ncbi:MAG: hypothetical protein AAF571_00860 [Verrucomicrobiota bacterium]